MAGSADGPEQAVPTLNGFLFYLADGFIFRRVRAGGRLGDWNLEGIG